MPEEADKQHRIDPSLARRLFKEYVQAKKAVGQSTKGLSYGTLLEKLTIEAQRLRDQLGQDIEVRFEVKTLDGKVRLRALRAKGNGKTRGSEVRAVPPVVPPAARSKRPPPIPAAKAAGVMPPPFVADPMRSTLAALLEEEDEPLPATAGQAVGDLAATQKLSFATLGDIARRMQELAERKQAPEREVAQAQDRAVLEGESSGEADIRAVAASLKKKMADPIEAGAPSPAFEGESIPISITDDDDVAAAAGFGDPAAVSLVEHASIASDDPVGSARTSASSGSPLGILLLLVVMAAGGVGWVKYGDQLMGRMQAQQVDSAASVPPLDERPEVDRALADDGSVPADESTGSAAAGETGEQNLAAGADEAGETAEAEVPAPTEEPGRRREGKKAKSQTGHRGDPVGGDTGQPSPEGGEALAPVEPRPGPDQPVGAEVDCLLNPGAKGCKPAEKPAPVPDQAPAVPDKLSQDQLRDGFQKVKGDAKTCGQQFGTPTGTKVSVKVSIEGKTGGISSAAPLDEHTGTALGKCVADALRRASFPPFASPAMGVTWSIKM